jgi:hypothetical protein
MQHDYWVDHCEGFRVDGLEGRIGLVEEVCDDPAHGGHVLVVRAGLLGRRVLLIPTSEVANIAPSLMRLWLRSPATIAGSEPAPLRRRRDGGRRPAVSQAA